MTEIWKDIQGYEGLYQVSNKGRVKSLISWCVGKREYFRKESIIHPTDNGNGYKLVGLKKNKKRKNYYVHRLVAYAFIPKTENKNHINHIDYDRSNNAADNLEWCTAAENIHHSVERMRVRKAITKSNTGEKYISYRKDKNLYRITIDKKEYPSAKTLDEAIKKRDEILKGVI